MVKMIIMNIPCVTFNTTEQFVRNYIAMININVIKNKINSEDDIDEHSMCHVQYY